MKRVRVAWLIRIFEVRGYFRVFRVWYVANFILSLWGIGGVGGVRFFDGYMGGV